MAWRPIQHVPHDLIVQEAHTDDDAELELVTLELCERVRRTGIVSADSMWEASPHGELTDDVPAWRLYNPVRGRRAEAEAERLKQEQAAEELERRAEKRAQQWNERHERRIAEHERLEQLKRDAESQQERIARLQREALEASWRIAHDLARASETLRRDAMMANWRAVVARNGWSDDEAATRWHDWLTGPPGLFG